MVHHTYCSKPFIKYTRIRKVKIIILYGGNHGSNDTRTNTRYIEDKELGKKIMINNNKTHLINLSE